jgi:hypothetical protein
MKKNYIFFIFIIFILSLGFHTVLYSMDPSKSGKGPTVLVPSKEKDSLVKALTLLKTKLLTLAQTLTKEQDTPAFSYYIETLKCEKCSAMPHRPYHLEHKWKQRRQQDIAAAKREGRIAPEPLKSTDFDTKAGTYKQFLFDFPPLSLSSEPVNPEITRAWRDGLIEQIPVLYQGYETLTWDYQSGDILTRMCGYYVAYFALVFAQEKQTEWQKSLNTRIKFEQTVLPQEEKSTETHTFDSIKLLSIISRFGLLYDGIHEIITEKCPEATCNQNSCAFIIHDLREVPPKFIVWPNETVAEKMENQKTIVAFKAKTLKKLIIIIKVAIYDASKKPTEDNHWITLCATRRDDDKIVLTIADPLAQDRRADPTVFDWYKRLTS